MAPRIPGLFAPPSIRRAPVAPMQRRLGRSMFGAQRRPPAQEGPFQPQERPFAPQERPFGPAPHVPKFPVPETPDVPETGAFPEAGLSPFGLKRSTAIARGMTLEDVADVNLGTARIGLPSRPTIPRTIPYYVYRGESYFTEDEAREAAKAAGDDNPEIAIYEMDNPDYKSFLGGLSAAERSAIQNARAGIPFAAPASITGGVEKPAPSFRPGKQRPAKVVLDDGSWYWAEPDPETGEQVRVGSIHPPEKPERPEKPTFDQPEEYRSVPHPTDARVRILQRVQRKADGSWDIQNVRTEWTPEELARQKLNAQITGRAQAQTGGITAANISAGGAPLVRTFAPPGFKGSTEGVTFFGPGAGFNPDAPAGSEANPYGARSRRGLEAEAINAENARRETARLQNVGNARTVAQRIRDVAGDPTKLQTLLQGMGPQGVAKLYATLSQYDEAGSFADVLKMLEASAQPGFGQPPARAFTRFAGRR